MSTPPIDNCFVRQPMGNVHLILLANQKKAFARRPIKKQGKKSPNFTLSYAWSVLSHSNFWMFPSLGSNFVWFGHLFDLFVVIYSRFKSYVLCKSYLGSIGELEETYWYLWMFLSGKMKETYWFKFKEAYWYVLFSHFSNI